MSQRIAHWTLWICILLSGNAAAQLLTKGEYFFDNDPGEGFGTLIYVNPQSPNPNLTFNAPASGLAPGFHFFSMRFQDEYGHWGITGTHKIYINQPFFPFPAEVLSMPIVEAEYFWDTDPGCGNATPFYMPAGNNITTTFSAIAPATAGQHVLSIRAQDLDGRWGITRSQSIQVWPVNANVADVDFTLNPNPAALNQNIVMTSQVTGALPGAIYEWDFNSDGATDATSTNTNHAYNTAGYKHVSLTVCNPPSTLAQAADMRFYFTNGSLADAGGLMSNLTGTTQWQYGRQGDLSGAPLHPLNPLSATSTTSQVQDNYTLSYWMKASSFPSNLLQLGSPSNQYQGIDNNGYHRWSNGNTIYSNAWSPGVNGLYNNQWHHIALTVSGVNMNSYVDGVLVQSQTWGGSAINPSSFQLAGSTNLIDDVLFYNTTLSDAQIQLLWQEMYASTKVHEIPVGPVFNLQLTANGPLNFCSGSNVVLTAPAANSYYWNTGETTQSIIVTETGSYQCVMNFGTYSIASAQKDVLVRPTPNVNSIVYQPTNGVPNGSIYLNVSGGSFPVYTYAWNNGNTTPGRTQLSGGNYSVVVSDGYCPQTLNYSLVNQAVNPPVGFVEAEFFYGSSDPGPGNAIGFSIPMLTPNTGGAFDIPTTGLPIGFHLLSVRTKYSDGSWSTTKTQWIHIKPDYSNPVNYDTLDIVQGELFFDNVDPGVGNGVPISFTANTELNFTASNVSLAGLTPGYHKVSVRMRDVNGDWGITRTTVFLIDYVLPPTLSPLQSPMIAAEYFYGDVDPGQGNAIAISIPTDSSLNVNRVINTTGLAEGNHRLNVRVKDLSGVWSTTKTSIITITAPCSLPQANFTAAENSLNQLTLTSTSTGTTGSTSYSWDIDANGTVDYSTSTATHDFPASGWYDVILIVSNGSNCQTSVLQNFQVGVVLDNNITADGPTTFCEGSQVVLYAPEGSGFIWSDFSQLDYLVVTNSGSYQCAYTDINGDYVMSSVIHVEVIPGLDVVTTTSQATNGNGNGSALVQVSGGSNNLYSYSWSNGSNTPGIASVMAGNYTVTVTDGICPQTLSIEIGNTIIQPLTGIIAAEYYFDADPGVGNGFPLAITQGSPINALANVPINLAPGYHTLFVRTMDAQFEWGFSRPTPIMVWDPTATSQNTPADNIIRGEYFFDNNDPGGGNATAFTITNPGTNVLESITVNTTGLSSGAHYVYVRLQDADGRWGMISRSMFIIEFDLPPILPDFQFPIVAMEYFFDSEDPGVGNAIPSAIPIGTTVNTSASIDMSGLSVGNHKVSIRVKDQWGLWSQTRTTTIQVVTPTCPVPEVSFDLTGTALNANIQVASTSTNTLLSSVYSWDWNGDGNYDAAGESVSHNFNTPGNYLVVLQVNNGNASCTSTASQLITVGVNPNAVLTINGGLEICEGNTTQLTAPAGTNYIWSNAEVGASISVTETGTYSCTFQSPNGVWLQSNDVFVLVRPALNLNPVISPSTNGLSNGSAGVIVTGGSTPAYDYTWSNGATTPIIASVLAGNYTVTATDGYCPATLSVLVNNITVSTGLVRGEYFWGTIDPGPGNGTDILVTQGSPISSFANIATTGLSAGYHILSVRMIDFDGQWGITRTTPVYISPVQLPVVSELLNITELEYFFDNTDPGVTNAVSLPLTASDTLITESYAISCAALGPGNHKISMRVKDSFGKWSVTKTASFNTCYPPPAPPLTLDALGDTINAGQACLGSSFNFVAQNNVNSLRWTAPDGIQTHVGTNWNKTNLTIQDSGYYWVQALGNEPGCYSEPSLYHLTILESPVITENLSGEQIVCPYDGPEAYFINPVENAVFYTWNMPTGAALLTGNNTNNASITFENVIASSGGLSLTAANQCGSSTSAILALNFPCVEEDYDADGTINLLDNCYLIANANQLDSDTDGIGDVCDNCPFYANPDQSLAVLYQDADGDGYGNSAITVLGCPGATGTSSVGGDCNDSNSLMHELFNFYSDTDGDGYGAGTVLTPVCAQSSLLAPAGFSIFNNDCAAANSLINPGAMELCGNTTDDDCDNAINEGCLNTVPGDDPSSSISVLNIPAFAYGVQNNISVNLAQGSNSIESPGAGNDVWYSFVATGNAARIALTGSSTVADDNAIELYSSVAAPGTIWVPLSTEDDVHPGSLGTLSPAPDGGSEILYYGNLVPNQTYYLCLRNVNNLGGTCNLSVSFLRGSQADILPFTGGTGVYNNTCANFKSAFRSQSSGYVVRRWQDQAAANAAVAPSGLGQGTPSWSYAIPPQASGVGSTTCQLGKILPANLSSGQQTYYVTVDVIYNLKDAAGNNNTLTAFGTVASPVILNAEAPLTVRSTDLCSVGFKRTTSFIATNRSVCGTARYDWKFKMAYPTQGLPTYIAGGAGATRLVGMGSIPGIANGQRYDVWVRAAHLDGVSYSVGTAAGSPLQVNTWFPTTGGCPSNTSATCDGNASCVKTIGNAGMVLAEQEYEEEVNVWSAQNIQIFPNPNAGDEVMLSVTGMEGVITIEVMDAMGRWLQSTTSYSEGHITPTLTFEKALSSGLYEVRVSNGKEQRVLRMVVGR
jgi:PKD repeat protein